MNVRLYLLQAGKVVHAISWTLQTGYRVKEDGHVCFVLERESHVVSTVDAIKQAAFADSQRKFGDGLAEVQIFLVLLSLALIASCSCELLRTFAELLIW